MKKKKIFGKRVPFNPQIKNLPQIKLLAERNVNMVEIDLDMDDETYAVLAQAGWEAIQHDKPALANYAIVEALKEFVKSEKEKDARHIA